MRATCAGSDADEGTRDPAGCRTGGVHGSREEFGGKGGRKGSRRGVRRRGRPELFLDVSPAGALTRLAGDTSRPLLSGEDREKAVAELMARRRPAYSEADFRVDTENLTPDRVAGKVLHLLARGTKGGPSGERAGKERRGR